VHAFAVLSTFTNGEGIRLRRNCRFKSMETELRLFCFRIEPFSFSFLARLFTMSNSFLTNTSQIKNGPSKFTGLSDDLEEAGKSLSQDERAVLQVIDAPFDRTRPYRRAVFCLNDNIDEGIRNLPPHGGGTARILDVTVHSDFVITGLRDTKGPETTRPIRDILINFLQETYTQPFDERRIFRWLHDPLPVNDIGSISSQWSQHLGGGKNFYRLVNRTSLQQDPLDYDLHPRDSYLTCAQDEHDRLIGRCVNNLVRCCL
jgi:hypothetical protein